MIAPSDERMDWMLRALFCCLDRQGRLKNMTEAVSKRDKTRPPLFLAYDVHVVD